jgi:hypothetical protein
MRSPNLFTRLHKWAHRQDENFLTETFAFVLQFLLDQEPELSVRLVRELTGERISLPPADAKHLEIRTQVLSDEGTLDIELKTPGHLVYIEVKSASEVRLEQLVRYRRLIDQSDAPSKWLILLTRYPAPTAVSLPVDFFVRWFQVAEWLQRLATEFPVKPVGRFLIEQFIGFLRQRNMVMGQVTWELPAGVRALRSLADMLYEAANGCGIQAQIMGGKNEFGVWLDGKRYWAGVYFDRPEMLQFETYNTAIDKNKAENLAVGAVYEWSTAPGFGWKREIDLESEDAHFFSRSKPSQLNFLETFMSECIAFVREIEVASPSQNQVEGAVSEEEGPEGQ